VPRPVPAVGERAVLARAAVATAFGLLALATTLLTAATATGQASTATAVAGAAGQAAVFAVTALVLHRRASGSQAEAELWRWLSRALAALALGALVKAAARLAEHGAIATRPELLGSGLATLVAAPLLYRGLILWNRVGTSTSDPKDWLNGLSGALAIAAVGDLLITWRHPGWEAGPWWIEQLSTLQVGALLLLFGTVLTVAVLSDLLLDPRAWLAGLAMLALTALTVTDAARHGGVPVADLASLGWVLVAAGLAVSAVLRAHPALPQAARTQDLAGGTLVVLVCSVATIAAASRLDPRDTLPTVVLAGLAVAGACVNAMRLVGDLTQLARTRQEARTDDLTQLANRRSLLAALEEALASGSRLALLVLDLDRFKEVNDRFGHAAGDELLRWCAHLMLEASPAGSTAARLGGDEFALLLPGADLDAAHVVARRVAALGEHPVPVGVHRLRVGASVGIAVSDDGRTTGSELLRRADTAMYLAKGREPGVAVYDDEADRRARERALLAVELQDALGTATGARSQFVVHYQPQLSVRTGEVVGAEALVRWQHPRLGLLAPDRFLDLLEERGHMGALTAHVLSTAAGQSRRWREQGRPLRLSVNLSTSCLTDPDLLATLREVLQRSGTDPSDLVLEVTETTLMEDPAVSLRTCEQIAALGIGLSIDDYGTGYSSLAYLADLPATELKLDRSFTDRAVADPRIAAIVAGTVTLGHALGLRVVAEGVENVATLDLLRRLGCDESQGFLHCRPVAAAEFSRWAAEGPVAAREPA